VIFPPDRPARPSLASGVGRTSLLLVPVALASRGAAFLIPIAIAAWYGVGPVTDAWYWALAFPTFALVLASTSLGTAATPALSRLRSAAPTQVPGFVGGLLVWAALASLALGTLVCLAAGPMLPRITDFTPSTVALAQRFLWELLPFMVLTTAGAVLRVGCEVHGRFFEVALTPVIRASTVIGLTWALLGRLGPHALPWGLVAGEAVQAAFYAAVLWFRDGIRPTLTTRLDPAVRGVVADLAPILGGEVLVALNLVIDKGFAATLNTGSVATLEYADRARVIPQTLLESTLVMVAYATWSNLFATGQAPKARRSVIRSLQWVIALASPVLAGMFIGRTVLVSLLFERGAFTGTDTIATASLLGWYLPGVLPNLLGILAVRAHVMERNLRLVFVLGCASMLVNTALNALFIGPLGLTGLALATTLDMLLIPTLYLVLLSRSFGPSGLGLGGKGWQQSIGLALLAGLTAVCVELGPGPPTHLLDPVLWIAAVVCLGLLGVGWRLTGPSTSSAPD